MENKTVTFLEYQIRSHEFIIILLLLLITGAFRLWLICSNSLQFTGDEAIVALMAKHIILGKETPLFFYGQTYMGSLDAYLVALGYLLFGIQVWVIRFIQAILYLLVVYTGYLLGKKLSGSYSIGFISALFLAIPNLNTTLYTSVSLGGYVEALLICNLILLVTLKIRTDSNHKYRAVLWLIFGIFVTFGFWVLALTLIYSISALIYLIWYFFTNRSRHIDKFEIRYILYFVTGMTIGLLPIFIYLSQGDLASNFSRLIDPYLQSNTNFTFFESIAKYSLNFILLGLPTIFGIRPPWEVRWVILPLAPLVIFFWIACIVFLINKKSNFRKSILDNGNLLWTIVIINVLAFIFTTFGIDPTGRYFLALTVPLSIFAATFIINISKSCSHWVWILPILILGYHFFGMLEAVYFQPQGLTPQLDINTRIDREYDQELVNFLKDNHYTRGYSTYWVSFPLAFLSNEEIIYAPLLPYHQDLHYANTSNRYQPYIEAVTDATRRAYITTHNKPLNQYLRRSFKNLGVKWSEKQIGDYFIFYDLSNPVTPSDIGY